MKDIVIGSIINYDWNKIKYWVNSLDRSGFTGDKLMICFNIDSETLLKLKRKKYHIISLQSGDVDISNFNIVVDRFLYMWKFLKNCKDQYRYVIATDVKDVIFQKNPSIYLEDVFNGKTTKLLNRTQGINISTESIKYKDESWGANNLFTSFGPSLYNHLKENVIFNCGVLSGKYDSIVDMFLSIYLLSNGASGRYIDGGGGPDQAALNILLNMKAWKDITIVNNSESSWAAQLGTTGPQIHPEVWQKVIELTPIMLNKKICTNGTRKVYSIVHQYDRFPEWRSILEKYYED